MAVFTATYLIRVPVMPVAMDTLTKGEMVDCSIYNYAVSVNYTIGCVL